TYTNLENLKAPLTFKGFSIEGFFRLKQVGHPWYVKYDEDESNWADWLQWLDWSLRWLYKALDIQLGLGGSLLTMDDARGYFQNGTDKFDHPTKVLGQTVFSPEYTVSLSLTPFNGITVFCEYNYQWLNLYSI